MAEYYSAAGVPREAIKSIGGWRSDTAFERYAIADDRQQLMGIEKAAAFAGVKPGHGQNTVQEHGYPA
jgi:hypothetical protein